MDLASVLSEAVKRGASDVHLKVGKQPVMRHDGELSPLDSWPALSSFDLQAVLDEIGALSPARVRAFEASGELDTAYQIPDLPRFRVNAFRQRGDISFAFRVIPRLVPDFESLELPPGVAR